MSEVLDRLRTLDARAEARTGQSRGYSLRPGASEGGEPSVDRGHRSFRPSLPGWRGRRQRKDLHCRQRWENQVGLDLRRSLSAARCPFRPIQGCDPGAAPGVPGGVTPGNAGGRRESHRQPRSSANVGGRGEELEVPGPYEGRQNHQEGAEAGGSGHGRTSRPFAESEGPGCSLPAMSVR